MSKLVHLPRTRDVREQAASWIVGLEEGLSEQQTLELKAWLAEDPAHRAAFVQMAKQWDNFDALAELATILPLETASSRRNRFALAGALVATVAACAIAAVLYFDRQAAVPTVEVAQTIAQALETNHDFQTSVGQQLTSKLPDGSSVSLNTDTALTVEFSDAERLIILDRGEASFDVAHDATRPFRVKAGDHTVQALGTVFDVRRQEGSRVRVTVSEGVVKVSNPADSSHEAVLVRAGQVADLGEVTARVVRVDPSRLDAAQAWQRGVLIYEGQTLEDVVADISRYTPVRFRIEDDSIRQRRVGGVFRAGDVDGLLLALQESFGVEPHRQGDVVVLSEKK